MTGHLLTIMLTCNVIIFCLLAFGAFDPFASCAKQPALQLPLLTKQVTPVVVSCLLVHCGSLVHDSFVCTLLVVRLCRSAVVIV